MWKLRKWAKLLATGLPNFTKLSISIINVNRSKYVLPCCYGRFHCWFSGLKNWSMGRWDLFQQFFLNYAYFVHHFLCVCVFVLTQKFFFNTNGQRIQNWRCFIVWMTKFHRPPNDMSGKYVLCAVVLHIIYYAVKLS